MNKIFLFLIIAIPATLFSQVDRMHAPKPGPAPVIKVGEPAAFTLPNGLKVFVVQNTKLPRISATLTIEREAILEGEKAGMISMAGDLFRRGTTSMNKVTLDEEIDYLGATINTTARSVNAMSLTNNFPTVFKLMADIALHPSFPADELEKIRRQELSSLAQNKEDANAIAGNVVSRLVYGKSHPYGEVETETSVAKVTVDDIRKYYDTYWKPNIAYLIFVGDITVDQAKRLAESGFGKWEKAVVPDPVYTMPRPPAKTYIAVVDRPSSVQSVINIVTPFALKPGAPDAIPSSVMNSLLGNGSSGRLYKNLRENHGFTYGAYSQIKTDKLVGNFTASAAVRNEKTDSAIGEFFREFRRIRSEEVSNADVSQTKNEMSGSFARSLESPSTIANFALNVARYNLPKDYYQNYLRNLGAVDNAAVRAMADKYIQPGNMHIVIVGNAREIAKGLEKYGEVKYFDVYGNEKAPPSDKKMDASLTAESILQKSIDAQGGQAAMNAIRDLTMAGTASVMGQTLAFSQKFIFPGAYVQSISMGEVPVMKQLMKGTTYTASQQGQEIPVTDEDKEDMNESAALFLEPYLLKQPGYTFIVKGIEPVEGSGKDAYGIEIRSPKGRVFTNYYDSKSFLPVKSAKSQDGGPAGKVIVQTYFNEYRMVNGVQVPVKIVLDQGQLKISFDVKDVKVNQGLKVEDIK